MSPIEALYSLYSLVDFKFRFSFIYGAEQMNQCKLNCQNGKFGSLVRVVTRVKRSHRVNDETVIQENGFGFWMCRM